MARPRLTRPLTSAGARRSGPLGRRIARRREAVARVAIVDVPESAHAADGSVTTKQTAEVTLPRSELDRMWSPEYLERLARTYWRFLSRVSLGALRVLYTAGSREVVLLARPLVLLRFHRPEYEIEPHCGTVTWRIDRGVLVAPAGRGKGYLRISVRRPPGDGGPTSRPAAGVEPRRAGGAEADEVTATVSSEVANFYPTLALGAGSSPRWLSRLGRALYRVTQLRVHVIVTHAFLRSLARLDLAPSVVGALRAPAEPEPVEPATPAAPR